MQNEPSPMPAARRRAFLDALAVTGVVTEACRAASVSRKTAYLWRSSDAGFAEGWDESIATAADALETEARRRALDGVLEPVYHRGQLVFSRDPETGEVLRDSNGQPIPATVSRRSDRLLELMLMAKKPEQYGRKTVDVNQRVEAVPKPPAPELSSIAMAMSPERRARFHELLEFVGGEDLRRAAMIEAARAAPDDDAF